MFVILIMFEWIAITGLGVGVYKYATKRIAINKILSNIHLFQKAINEINEFYSNYSEYFNYNKLVSWYQKHKSTLKLLESVKEGHMLDIINKDESIKFFFKLYKNGNKVRKEYNLKYVENELKVNKKYFDSLSEEIITEEQRTSIVTDDDINYINAGAGTGKTFTIINNVRYLVDKKNVDQKRILLLAFNKDAAEQLKSKLESYDLTDINAKTFHAFGLNVIKEIENKTPDIFEYSSRENMKYFDNLFLELYKSNPQFLNSFTIFFTYYYRTYKPFSEFETEREYNDFLMANPPITIKGEQVKSLEEVYIANTLFRWNVNYVYEQPYHIELDDRKKKRYCPDFYLKDYDIYIEHFALDENYESIFGKKYVEEYYSKLEIHETNETNLICTYSHQIFKGEFLPELKKKLENNNVKIVKKSDTELLKQLKETSNFEILLFTKLITTFLNLYKSKNESMSNLRKISKTIFKDKWEQKRTKLFLDIFSEILDGYNKHLDKEGCIDFNDMINNATSHLKAGSMEFDYQYIFVDEFQDISDARNDLVQAIRNNSDNPKMFVVGDDWQSIYRFSGSDIDLLLNFDNYYGEHYTITQLTETFRFGKEIADVSNEFILKNPKQLKKEIKSKPIGNKPFQFIEKENEYRKNGVEGNKAIDPIAEIIEIIDQIKREAGIQRKKYSILILNRYRKSTYKKYIPILKKYKHDKNVQIEFRTIHSCKGLTFDYVIIDDVEGGKRMGFPSGMSDDEVLKLVLKNHDEYPYSEERRLFYVAITRARYQVFLCYRTGFESMFVNEVKEILGLIKLCPKCGNTLMKKQNKNDDNYFWGCSSWIKTRCDYTEEFYDEENKEENNQSEYDPTYDLPF